MTPEFKAVTPERAVEIMKAWAYHPWPMVVSRGGGNELGECFLWGEVVEGGAGAVARFVGDGARAGVGGW